MSSRPGLSVSRVCHAYGRLVAAHEVDLTVRPGDVHCLLGPSGSGKSTLLRLIAGLETLQQGRIAIAGTEVAGPGVHLAPERRSIGFVFQDYALFPHLDVWHNVAFGMARGPRAVKRAAAGALLERVGMAGSARAMPHTLSGGQQQRVALARALAREPAVMLLDEPFSGLDAQLREDVRRTTLDLLRAAGVATVMVTHDPREALVAADLVSVIRRGRIIQTGPPGEVYDRSASRQVAEVFGPVNRLVGTVQAGAVATPCGAVPAPGFADHHQVEVLIRPESIRLLRQPRPDAAAATVVALIPEGAMVRLAVALEGGVQLESRDLARHGWRIGERVFATLASESVMVHSRHVAAVERGAP